MIVKTSDEVPAGYDDHVVVSIDREALSRERQRAALSHSQGSHYYYYGRPTSGSSRPTATVTRPSSPAPSGAASAPARHGQRQFGHEAKRARY